MIEKRKFLKSIKESVTKDEIDLVKLVEFNKDEEIFLEVVKKWGDLISFAHISLLKNKKIVLEAIKTSEDNIFSYIEHFYYNDKDIALEAVKKDGSNLWLVSPLLKKDKDIIKYALNNNPNAIVYVAPSVLEDKDFILECIKLNPYIYCSLPSYIKEDIEVSLFAIKQLPKLIEYVPYECRKNKKIINEVRGKIGR